MVGASMMWQEFRTYSREALIAFYEEAIKGPASDYLVEGSKELRAWMLRGLEEGQGRFNKWVPRVIAIILALWAFVMLERSGMRQQVVGNIRQQPPRNPGYRPGQNWEGGQEGFRDGMPGTQFDSVDKSTGLNFAEILRPKAFTPPAPRAKARRFEIMPGVEGESKSWRDLIPDPLANPKQYAEERRPQWSPPPPPPPRAPRPPKPPMPEHLALKKRWQDMQEAAEERKQKLKDEFEMQLAELTPEDHLGPQLRIMQNQTDEAIADEESKREEAMYWRGQVEETRLRAMQKRQFVSELHSQRHHAFPTAREEDMDPDRIQKHTLESAEINGKAVEATLKYEQTFASWKEALTLKKELVEKLEETKREKEILCAKHASEAIKQGIMC